VDFGVALLIGMAWVGGLGGGSLVTLGVIEAVTGRVVINLQRFDWSRNEATWLGLSRVIQGLAIALYSLVGGLALGAHVLPVFWAGHAWGVFVLLPFWLVVMAALLFQAGLEWQHEGRKKAFRR
jgi:hypothetical protein